MYEWIDPKDAIFVREVREALKIERKAWDSCHAERMKLLDQLDRIRRLIDGHQRG
jgi:hypothetical protein